MDVSEVKQEREKLKESIISLVNDFNKTKGIMVIQLVYKAKFERTKQGNIPVGGDVDITFDI